MLLRHPRWCVACAVLVLGIGVGWTFAQPGASVEPPAPETLLPAGSLLYVEADGQALHEDAWKATAAYKALQQSGLGTVVERTVKMIREQAAQAEAGPAVDLALTAAGHLRQHGLSLAVTVAPQPNGPPSAFAVLVLHRAASFEQPLADLLTAVSEGELNFVPEEREGRKLKKAIIPNTPGVEIAFWNERGHLLVVAGLGAVDSALAIAAGSADNITKNPLWTKYIAVDREFEVTAQGWLDVAKIRGMTAGIPLPINAGGPNAPEMTVGTVLEMLGLDTLNAVVSASGAKGAALWGETWVEAPGPRKGLLALSDSEPLTLADLPPMPFGLSTFTATRFSAGKLYDELLRIADQAAALVPDEDVGAQLNQAKQELRTRLGFDLREELLGSLGDVLVAYNDNRQGILSMGAGFVLEVRDAARFRKALEQLLQAAEQQSQGAVRVRRVEKYGRTLYLTEFAPTPFGYTLCQEGKWLVIGSPQVVEAFLLRVDGVLPSWSPSPEHLAAFSELPGKFAAITVSDPRGLVNFAMGLLPIGVGILQTAIRESGEFPPGLELPFNVEDIPPAELVSTSLFPNVLVAEVTDAGFHYTSRMSLPTLPLLGSGDAATTTAVVAVGTALLLPAVQQARIAARRAESQNNLRQLALAIHNYADAHRKLPSGTILNSDLKPEERLSWLVQVLPYVEQAALYEQMDRAQGWKSAGNRNAVSAVIRTFVNPGIEGDPLAETEDGWAAAVTDYVGIAGVGEDGPLLPVTSPKAGMFAYDRATRFQDVTDGTSNTLMMSEATGRRGAWASGGRATIRPLTTKPYINGPDGIGGPYPGGANMGMADGSVRFVNQNIDPSVLEALSTIRGGEVIPSY